MSTVCNNAALESAVAEFLDSMRSLPPAHQNFLASCTNENELLENVQKLDMVAKNSRTGKQYSDRIERFTEKIAFFLCTIDKLTQCNPIYASSVWGFLSLVIETAGQFATLFEKLTRGLDRLASSFPFLKVISAEATPVPEKIQHVLDHIHRDLFAYFSSLARVFLKKYGEGDNPIPSNKIWKSFDRMFDETVEKMDFYSEVVKEEIELFKLREIDMAQITSQQVVIHGDDNVVERIDNWLAAPSFAIRYDELIAQRENETAQWIFDRPEYKSWLESPSVSGEHQKNVLWISGSVGSGKSVLAASAVQHLKNITANALVCYFFFDSRQQLSNDSTTAYRSILSQMLQQRYPNDSLLDKFTFSMKYVSHGQSIASHSELAELLTLCCKTVGSMYLVLDGLDECEDHLGLMNWVSEIQKISALQIALSSRSTFTHLPKHISGLKQLTINSLNHADIQRYLTNKLSGLVEDSILPPGLYVGEREHAINNLALRSSGIFLWAKLMIVYIQQSALILPYRLKAIMKVGPPESLDNMFDRIFKLMTGNISFSRQIFMWLLYARREMSIRELEEAIAIYSNTPKGLDLRENNNFQNRVIATCISLVELDSGDKHSRDGSFRFVHASVKEYLLGEAKFGKYPLAPSENDAHVVISRMCLKYLIYSMPAQPLSGSIGTDVNEEDLNSAFPFSKYAASNWIHHLYTPISNSLSQSSLPSTPRQSLPINGYDELLSVLLQFLSQPRVLMAWIESCYTYKLIPSLEDLQNWSTEVLSLQDSSLRYCDALPKVILEISKLVEYLRELERDWGSNLLKIPGCIWEEVTAFLPSSLLLQNSATKFHSLKSSSTTAGSKTGREINKISQTTSDGIFSAILSIWTSSLFDEFERLRISNAPISELFQTLQYSSGWVAKYEIFSVKEHKRVAFVDMPLEPSEVWLQLSQTLMRDALQFPLSINHDGSCFTVLRTLYTLKLTSDKKALNCKSEVLPLPMTEENEPYWMFPDENSEKLMLDDYYRFKNRQWERVYLYWIYFDQQNCHLCFIEQTRATPTSFTMFSIPNHSENTFATRPMVVAQSQKWLRKFSNKYDGRDEKQFELAFHPYLSILAVSAVVGVYLWKFDDHSKMLKAGDGLNGEIGNLSFSDCGRHCIISNGKPGISPIVYSLNSNHLVGDILETNLIKKTEALPVELQDAPSYSDSESKVPPLTSQLNESKGSMLSVLEKESSKKPVIRGSTLLRRSDESQSIMQVTSTGNSKEVMQQWTNGLQQVVEESLTLTLLPNWSGIESLQPNIALPTSDDEPVRIVLDKVSQTWNSMSGSTSDSKFPAIVERDPRSFRRPGRKESVDAFLEGQQAGAVESKSLDSQSLPERSYKWASSHSAGDI